MDSQKRIQDRAPSLKKLFCTVAVAQAQAHATGRNASVVAAAFQEAAGVHIGDSRGEWVAADGLHDGLEHAHGVGEGLVGGGWVGGVEGHEVVHIVDEGGDVVGGQSGRETNVDQ